MAVAIRTPRVFIQKEEIPILSSKRIGSCSHRGSSRKAIKIAVFREVDGKRRRLAWLRSIRSCCVDDLEVRRAWWQETFRVLDTIFGTSPSKREREDRERLELRIRSWVPMPAGMKPLKKDLKLALKTAKELEITTDQAIAMRQQTTSPCWGIIGVYPGAGYNQIKEGLKATIDRLNREQAMVGEFRVAHHAAQECLERLRSGVW